MPRIGLVLAGLALGAPALAQGLDPATGKALFERRWVQAESAARSGEGLGPLFNAHACATCHKGGGPARFVVGAEGVGALGLVVRLAKENGAPDPHYGRQIQERALPGLVPEARILPRLAPVAASAILERMRVDLDLTGPALAAGVRQEIRVAPSLLGRGLIESVDARAVLALADPDDRDGDGVSGRSRLVRGEDGDMALGRFGLKAGRASIAQQVADAASLDMGLSSPSHPSPHGDCTGVQRPCLARAGSDTRELAEEMIRAIAAFVASLERPPVKEERRGSTAFAAAGCTACHVPSLPTADGGRATLHSDLLLHDLGPALAGALAEADVALGEWRTAPLIDLDPRRGMRRYLHDGRAASIEAAILWHGGEAERAKERFLSLSPRDRRALLDYVGRL